MPTNAANIQLSDRPDVQLPASAIMPVGGSLIYSPRILIVDDEPNIAFVLQRILANFFKAETTTAHNPKDALRIAHRETYDLVITDYQMPIMDGITLTKHLFQIQPTAKFIMLTAHDVQTLSEQIKNSPLDAIISKPISPQKLRQFISNLLYK